MVNAVILYCPGEEERARWLGQGWSGGRVTLCPMGPDRRRIALGARSVLVGLWSQRSRSIDGGRQLANVLAQSAGRAILLVWDGRPPLDAVTAAGVPVLVAPPEPNALMHRLKASATELIDGKRPDSDLDGARRDGDGKRARMWGLIVGALVGALLAIGGLAPLLAR